MKEEPNPPTPFPNREGGENPRPGRVRNIVRGQRVWETKLQLAKELRRKMTTEERLLWACVRRNQLGGYHFRRQQIIRGFVADFYCYAAGLVVEIDGPIHMGQAESDASREDTFRQLGIEVLRFRNDEVNQNLPDVLARILAECQRLAGGSGEPNRPASFPKREGGAGFRPSPGGGGAASEASGEGLPS